VGTRPFSNRGRSGSVKGDRVTGPPHKEGRLERVILMLGEIALVLAGVVCVVAFVLLIVSMLLLTVRKLLEFTRL
jgi:hypothetical protein